MAQHFLLSATARSLSPAKVMRMSERGAENVFVRLRWPQTDGNPVCPHCGCKVCYDCRRGEPVALALQGKSCRFLRDLGYSIRLAQVAAQDLSDGHRGVL